MFTCMYILKNVLYSNYLIWHLHFGCLWNDLKIPDFGSTVEHYSQVHEYLFLKYKWKV